MYSQTTAMMYKQGGPGRTRLARQHDRLWGSVPPRCTIKSQHYLETKSRRQAGRECPHLDARTDGWTTRKHTASSRLKFTTSTDSGHLHIAFSSSVFVAASVRNVFFCVRVSYSISNDGSRAGWGDASTRPARSNFCMWKIPSVTSGLNLLTDYMGDIKITISDFYSGSIKSAPLDPLAGFKRVVGGGQGMDK